MRSVGRAAAHTSTFYARAERAAATQKPTSARRRLACRSRLSASNRSCGGDRSRCFAACRTGCKVGGDDDNSGARKTASFLAISIGCRLILAHTLILSRRVDIAASIARISHSAGLATQAIASLSPNVSARSASKARNCGRILSANILVRFLKQELDQERAKTTHYCTCPSTVSCNGDNSAIA